MRQTHLATVDRRKVVDYLLDAGHPDNNGKAARTVWIIDHDSGGPRLTTAYPGKEVTRL